MLITGCSRGYKNEIAEVRRTVTDSTVFERFSMKQMPSRNDTFDQFGLTSHKHRATRIEITVFL